MRIKKVDHRRFIGGYGLLSGITFSVAAKLYQISVRVAQVERHCRAFGSGTRHDTRFWIEFQSPGAKNNQKEP